MKAFIEITNGNMQVGLFYRLFDVAGVRDDGLTLTIAGRPPRVEISDAPALNTRVTELVLGSGLAADL